MSKKKNGNGKKKVEAAPAAFDITKIDFAVEVARQILGKNADDKWVLGETATAIHHQLQLWMSESDDIQRIAKKADGLTLSFAIKSSRASTPSVVKVTGSYSEKHLMKAESDAVDTEQMDMFDGSATSTGGEGEPTSEQPEEHVEQV